MRTVENVLGIVCQNLGLMSKLIMLPCKIIERKKTSRIPFTELNHELKRDVEVQK